MRTHGKQKRRTWRKHHVAVNPDPFETVTLELTEATTPDRSSHAKWMRGASAILGTCTPTVLMFQKPVKIKIYF